MALMDLYQPRCACPNYLFCVYLVGQYTCFHASCYFTLYVNQVHPAQR